MRVAPAELRAASHKAGTAGTSSIRATRMVTSTFPSTRTLTDRRVRRLRPRDIIHGDDRAFRMIWGAAAAALILGLALGLVVRQWTLLLIPLVPYAGILVLAATGYGP